MQDRAPCAKGPHRAWVGLPGLGTSQVVDGLQPHPRAMGEPSFPSVPWHPKPGANMASVEPLCSLSSCPAPFSPLTVFPRVLFPF